MKSDFSRFQALEKSKYEQSLESVRRFIAISEKELELYCRHIALYGPPNDRNPISILDSPTKDFQESGKLGKESLDSTSDCFHAGLSESEADTPEVSETEDNFEDDDLSVSESDSKDNSIFGSRNEERELRSPTKEESYLTILDFPSMFENKYDSGNSDFVKEHTVDA